MLRTGCTIVWAVSHTRQDVPLGPPPTSGPDISISLTLPPSALVALGPIEHDHPSPYQRAGRTAEGARHYGISTHAHTRLNHNLTNLTIRILCCIWDSGPLPPLSTSCTAPFLDPSSLLSGELIVTPSSGLSASDRTYETLHLAMGCELELM